MHKLQLSWHVLGYNFDDCKVKYPSNFYYARKILSEMGTWPISIVTGEGHWQCQDNCGILNNGWGTMARAVRGSTDKCNGIRGLVWNHRMDASLNCRTNLLFCMWREFPEPTVLVTLPCRAHIIRDKQGQYNSNSYCINFVRCVCHSYPLKMIAISCAFSV